MICYCITTPDDQYYQCLIKYSVSILVYDHIYYWQNNNDSPASQQRFSTMNDNAEQSRFTTCYLQDLRENECNRLSSNMLALL